MSKKAQKRAARRKRIFTHLAVQPPPDGARNWPVFQERRGRYRTTPTELQRQAVREPFYLRLSHPVS
ncbi:hypothetical protein GCM10008955_01040 [Deinococcus malanensis]|uniref:Uncharacterized protein n=1 Tax=Deinococcus malanensis TaxID=1706855 RepID=A0ABQ2EGF5_9DEIO|nr:hypothetical protein GCM10008955_01040 [Deinococcus malanensis]